MYVISKKLISQLQSLDGRTRKEFEEAAADYVTVDAWLKEGALDVAEVTRATLENLLITQCEFEEGVLFAEEDKDCMGDEKYLFAPRDIRRAAKMIAGIKAPPARQLDRGAAELKSQQLYLHPSSATIRRFVCRHLRHDAPEEVVFAFDDEPFYFCGKASMWQVQIKRHKRTGKVKTGFVLAMYRWTWLEYLRLRVDGVKHEVAHAAQQRQSAR